MKEPRTICVKCRHYIRFTVSPPRPAWELQQCKALALSEHINPVTGERETATGEKYAYCSGLNHGNCSNYEKT